MQRRIKIRTTAACFKTILGLMALITAPIAGAQNTPDLNRISSAPIPPPEAREKDETVLVDGNPPLTAGMATRYVRFVGWLLELKLTAPQQEQLRSVLIKDWKGQKPDDIKSDTNVLEMESQFARRTPEEQAFLRAKLQPEVIKGLRDDIKNPDSQYLLAIYETSRKPIAPGTPPLTRPISDASAECFGFMIQEAGGRTIEVNEAFKEAWAQLMVQKYRTLPAAQQKTFAQLPELWATLRVAWAQASAPDREKMRVQWRETLQAALPKRPELIEAEKALSELNAYAKKGRGALTHAELLRGANDLEKVAKELRLEGGSKNVTTAAGIEQTAREFRVAAQPARQSANAAVQHMTSEQAYAAAMAHLQAQHSTYTMMMNMNTMSYVSNMNAISNIGSGGYHYEIRP